MRYDVEEMRRLEEVTESDYWEMLRCSQRDFGKLINRTGAHVNQLGLMGVVSRNCYGNVKVLASFLSYWREYLPPWEQAGLIASAVAEVESIARVKKSSALYEPRELGKAIRAAELLRLKCELLLRMLDGLPVALMAAFEKARRRVERLSRRQEQARRRLQSLIAKDKSPQVVKAVMTMRYIECRKFVDIAVKVKKSLRQVYRYHRRGLMALQRKVDLKVCT